MKKFLSLVLALVMTMSLVTISAGATDAKKSFNDAGKIQYTKAVDTVSSCDIIDGYTDGSFAPTGTLTRGAAAKIICNMVLGPTTASALGVDAKPFKDVAVDNVFAGYIAYCSQQGIINGYADGNFRPAGLVTGNQFMKMLLGALGYDGSIEGFTGANWTVAVIKLAKSLELDDGNDAFVGSKAMTREEACLYAYNTLIATMVEYKDNSSVTVGDITISNKSKATDLANNSKKETYDDDDLMQFCEKYFAKLTASSSTDDFGRPATTLKYDGDEIGTYAEDNDDMLVLNKNKTAAEAVYTDTDYLDYADGDVNSDVVTYVNGTKVGSTKATLASIALKAGDQIEIFEDDDDNVKTVAVIRYSLAQIDEISTSLSSTYTKKGATTSITLQDMAESSIGGTYYDKYDGDSDKELPGFAADTYKADTVLAVAMKGNVVLDSYVATVSAGKVSAYNGGSKANVTVDGTAYALHATVNTPAGDKDMTALSNVFNYNDTTYTVYTDKNNYAIGYDESDSVKIEDVYYVTCLSKATNLYNGTVYAQAVKLSDGSVTEFKLKSGADENTAAFGNSWATDGYGTDNIKPIKGLFTFDKDGSAYTADIYNTASDSTYYVYGIGDIAEDLAKDDTKMTVNGQKVYLNDKTNYIKVEDVGSDISVKTVTGGTSVQKTHTVSPKTYTTTAIAVCTKESGNYVSTYVILVSDDFATASSDDVVFVGEVSNDVVSYTDADGKTQKGYGVELYFLDGSGKVETETVKGSSAPDAGFYTWEINDDKVYELTSTNAALTAPTTATANVAYDDETGYVGFAKSGSDLNKNSGNNLTGIYNNTLSATGLAIGTTGTYTLNDVDFAKNVIVADGRDDIDTDAYYSTEITTVSQLKSAIDKANSTVQAVVYYDDTEVIMVYVTKIVPSVDNSYAALDSATVNRKAVTLYGTAAEAAANATSVKAGSAVVVAGYGVNVTYSVDADYTAPFTQTGTSYTYTASAAGKVDVVAITSTSTDTSKTVTKYVATKSVAAYGITGATASGMSVAGTTDVPVGTQVTLNLKGTSGVATYTVKATYALSGAQEVVLYQNTFNKTTAVNEDLLFTMPAADVTITITVS